MCYLGKAHKSGFLPVLRLHQLFWLHHGILDLKMPTYSDLQNKLKYLKDAMLRSVDFTKPYQNIFSQVEFIDLQIKRVSSLSDEAKRELRFGYLMSIVQMPKYLYDDMNWRDYPEVDSLINDSINIAKNLIETEKL